jgi:hypothetical protein
MFDLTVRLGRNATSRFGRAAQRGRSALGCHAERRKDDSSQVGPWSQCRHETSSDGTATITGLRNVRSSPRPSSRVVRLIEALLMTLTVPEVVHLADCALESLGSLARSSEP